MSICGVGLVLAALIMLPTFRKWVILLMTPIFFVFFFWFIGWVECIFLAAAILIWFFISQAYGIPFWGETPEEGKKRREQRIRRYGCGSRNTPAISEDYRCFSRNWKATNQVSDVDVDMDMDDETNPTPSSCIPTPRD
ncbi:MAG: hypothetical protein Q4D98_03190 [Planctomycetia bacterium]|nr:hypothetical protein [Planctomycetia bacterium]